MNNTKQSVIDTYIELFTRGEMLKAANFVNNCIPLELEEDKSILKLRKECNDRIDEIVSWQDGRPYPGIHAVDRFDKFPKFILAKERIQAYSGNTNILDIGCYSGVFAKEMARLGYGVTGVDIHQELMEKLEAETIKKDMVNLTFKFGLLEDFSNIERNWFGVVTAFDVLEHTVDFDIALSHLENACKPGGLIVINLPRMTPGYVDEAFEHLRMFSDSDIKRIWGDKEEFKFEKCKDEFGRPTSFITYIK